MAASTGRSVRLCAVAVLLLFGTSSAVELSTCLGDPTQAACADGGGYSMGDISLDLAALCAAQPSMSGCSVMRQCQIGAATGQYCSEWSLVATICQEKIAEGSAAGSACSTYEKLCLTEGTAVTQCTSQSSQPIPDFLRTSAAVEGMYLLCMMMPDMEPCRQCAVDSMGRGKCPDPLMSIAQVCNDHYMSDCDRWWEMCENKPLGLVPFCGEALSGTSEEAQAMGDGTCFGAMRMYFHTGGNDFVLFKEWVPCSEAQQAITIIAILTAGIFNGFLKALRARIEQNLAIRARDGEIEDYAAGYLMPRSWLTLKHNFLRSCFTFVSMTIDYLLMLIAMTFNIGFFLAAIFGISLGTLFFGHTMIPMRTKKEAVSNACRNDGYPGAQLVIQNPEIGAQMGSCGAMFIPPKGNEPLPPNENLFSPYMDNSCCTVVP